MDKRALDHGFVGFEFVALEHTLHTLIRPQPESEYESRDEEVP